MPRFDMSELQPDDYFENLRGKFTENIRSEQESVGGVKELLKYFATEINEEYGPPDIVNERGAIIGKENDEKIEKLQSKFKKDGESFEDYDSRIEDKHSIIFEMLVTVIFNKILKSEFIVVHTSKKDDFKHHADNVIIEKNTGNVICTLDEVNVNIKSNRYHKKSNEIKNYNKKNGTIIEDGVKLTEENKLINTTIKNVPLFLLQVSEERLEEILEKMDITSHENVSKIELAVFDELIKSLADQVDIMLKEKLPEKVKGNIERFSKSLENMISIRENNYPNTIE